MNTIYLGSTAVARIYRGTELMYTGVGDYAVGGDVPPLIADFENERYADVGFYTTFSGLLTFSRASSATYVDSTGTLQTAASGVARIGHHTYDGAAWNNAGLLDEIEARTNSIKGSRDLGGVDWTVACTATQDAVGIDGVSSSAWTLNDVNAASYQFVYQDVVIADDTATHVASVFIKKGSQSSDNAPALRFDYIGGTSVVAEVAINATTGAVVNASGGGAGSQFVEDWGDWWRLVVPMQNNGTGNTTARMYLYPAARDESATGAATLIGSAVFDQAQLELNAGVPSYPIITSTGATATRAADSITASLTAGTYDVRVVTDAGTTDLLSVVHTGGAYWPTEAEGVVLRVLVYPEGALA